MSNSYALYLYSNTGNRLAIIETFTGEYSKKVLEVGRCNFKLDYSFRKYFYPGGYFMPDCKIEIWKSIDGRAPALELETDYWIRKPHELTDNGGDSFDVTGSEAVNVLDTRYVLYTSGSSQAKKENLALDNMQKAIVRENFTAPVDTRRIMPNLTVAPDISAAPLGSKSFSFKKVTDVLREISQDSITLGTYLAFDVVRTDVNTYEFRTYTIARGADKQSLITLDTRLGTLANTDLTSDYENQVTYVTAGGQESGAARQLATSLDPNYLSYGPYGWREDFIDARNGDSLAAVQAEADAALRAGRAKTLFNADIISTGNYLYGVHYNFGDIVTAQKDLISVPCRLDAIKVSITDSGDNTELKLQSVI